ncbi:MAG: class I SAM-dependent methyltransferase [Neisseriaceae bacterium]|nr:class I SAM-dependent methyltransferase [Neisseriaceae bacterium]
MSLSSSIDFLTLNRQAWDAQALAQQPWSRPVSAELIAAAKAGQWQVHLTPQPLPEGWLGDVSGRKILCLASAGGQQAPVLAAAGADVTVFDLSDQQLAQDRLVAERDGLSLRTEQGDMRDLSRFGDASFDLIFQPIANLYVPSVLPVWAQCARVLKPGGAMLASFYNPVVFVADRDPKYRAEGVIKPKYTLPYSDLNDLSAAELAAKQARQEALVFGHSLTDLIAGQLHAGLLLADFYEDSQPQARFLIDEYLPTFLATKSIKPEG